MSRKDHFEGGSGWYCPGPTTPGGNGSFHPGCDQLVDNSSSFDPIGKIILCNFSFPSADAVFIASENRVSRQFLREYISFLEVLVLYEELLVVAQPYTVTKEEYENPDSPIHQGFGYFDFSGDANLRDKIDELRSTESWIKDTTFDLPDLEVDPTIYAAQSRAVKAGSAKNLGHPPHAEDLYYDVFHCGQAYAAYQVARQLSMPFYGPKVEYHPLVHKLEAENEIVEHSVIARMKDRLDSGAKAILEEFARQGYDITFNTSPIGALIIEKSQKPADMLSVALDLRDKYAPFRRNSLELETVLFNREASVREKMKAVAEIERVMTKLWGPKEGGFDRYIKSSGNFIDYALSYEEQGFSVKRVTELMVSAPVEYALERIRTRKYRLLFDARNSFLRQAAVEAKVAKLFVQDDERASEVDFQESTCLHWWGAAPTEPEQTEEREPSQSGKHRDLDDEMPF